MQYLLIINYFLFIYSSVYRRNIKRKLLNKIALKYTNQHLDYLEQYLL